MDRVNIHDAKTHFSKLIERVEAGEEIEICRHGKPVARLVAAPRDDPYRWIGSMKGEIWEAPDAWDPDPELEASFYEENPLPKPSEKDG